MLEKQPSLIPSTALGILEVLALASTQLEVGAWQVLAFYASFMFGFLLAVAVGSYLARSILYARSVSDISKPDVRLAASHADIARSIAHMNTEQMYHHVQIVNALQLPLRINPGETLITLEGMEITYDALKHYLDGMKAEPDTGAGEPVYQMSPERNASPQDRDAHRQIADEIGRSYAVSAPVGNKPVRTTKTKLGQYLEALMTLNE